MADKALGLEVPLVPFDLSHHMSYILILSLVGLPFTSNFLIPLPYLLYLLAHSVWLP